MIALLLILIPIFFALLIAKSGRKFQMALMYSFAILQHLIVLLIYFGWLSDSSSHFWGLHISKLGTTFLLGYTGLQLVATLSLPRKEAVLSNLLGILLLSCCTVLTITAAWPPLFICAFIAALFVPSLCSYLQQNDWRTAMVFLMLGILTSILVLIGYQGAFQNGVYRLNYWLMAAGIIRLGLVPFHLWLRRIVLKFPIQWSILFFLSYPSVALFMPLHHEMTSSSLTPIFMHLAWISALYGSALAIVQRELRSALYYLLVSLFGSIALGLAVAKSSLALSGVMLFWMSAGLSFAGFGLAIELLESRFGEITEHSHHGLMQRTPKLGTLFLIFGLASVGFPGMCVFVGEEVMLSGIYEHSGWAVIPILLALSLNGITVLRWFFSVFYGECSISTGEIELLKRERLAFLLLLAIIIGTGIYPQPLFDLGSVFARMSF